MGILVDNLLVLVNALRLPPVAPQVVIPPPIQSKLLPFGKWKVLKEQVYVNYFEDKFEWTANANKAKHKIEKTDIYLSDFVVFWMMELLPNLLSCPFQFAQTLRRRDQVNSLFLWQYQQ